MLMRVIIVLAIIAMTLVCLLAIPNVPQYKMRRAIAGGTSLAVRTVQEYRNRNASQATSSKKLVSRRSKANQKPDAKVIPSDFDNTSDEDVDSTIEFGDLGTNVTEDERTKAVCRRIMRTLRLGQVELGNASEMSEFDRNSICSKILNSIEPGLGIFPVCVDGKPSLSVMYNEIRNECTNFPSMADLDHLGPYDFLDLVHGREPRVNEGTLAAGDGIQVGRAQMEEAQNEDPDKEIPSSCFSQNAWGCIAIVILLGCITLIQLVRMFGV